MFQQYKYKMDWYSDIKIDDIPSEKLRDVAFKNGIDDAIALLRGVPGLRIYVPIYGFREQQRLYVKNNYTEKNKLSVSSHLNIDTRQTEYLSKKQQSDRNVLSNEYMDIVADKCGEGVATRLVKNFHGDFIYVPTKAFSHLRISKIIHDFNGRNSSTLSLKYGVSERYINKIISNSITQKHSIQLDLFQNIS